jgi:hypothetical protein
MGGIANQVIFQALTVDQRWLIPSTIRTLLSYLVRNLGKYSTFLITSSVGWKIKEHIYFFFQSYQIWY